ncbi:MAG: hypothetical protein QM756_46635 [Polyangiaceae bacterium]
MADARLSYAKVQRLLAELLELYRGEHLHDELRHKSVDLVRLAHTAAAGARHIARVRSIELGVHSELSSLRIEGDPEKLESGAQQLARKRARNSRQRAVAWTSASSAKRASAWKRASNMPCFR